MSFFKPAEPTRPREDDDTSDRPRQRRRTDAPQVPYIIEIKTQTLEAHSERLEGHEDYVNSVSFSRDGTKVASGSARGVVKVWDVTSGECTHHEAFLMCVQCVGFSRWDEGCVRISGQDGEAVGYDDWGVSADAGGAFFNGGKCVVFSRWDKVASGSYDETVKLWNVTSGECLQTLEGHSGYV